MWHLEDIGGQLSCRALAGTRQPERDEVDSRLHLPRLAQPGRPMRFSPSPYLLTMRSRLRQVKTTRGQVELSCLMAGCYRTSDDRYYIESRRSSGLYEAGVRGGYRLLQGWVVYDCASGSPEQVSPDWLPPATLQRACELVERLRGKEARRAAMALPDLLGRDLLDDLEAV